MYVLIDSVATRNAIVVKAETKEELIDKSLDYFRKCLETDGGVGHLCIVED